MENKNEMWFFHLYLQDMLSITAKICYICVKINKKLNKNKNLYFSVSVHLLYPLSLHFSLFLKLFLSPLEQLCSRVWLEEISLMQAHTETCYCQAWMQLRVWRLKGCLFPCQRLTAGCIWKWRDLFALWIPLLAPGPRPGGCVFLPAETLNRLCLCALCELGPGSEGVLSFRNQPPQHCRLLSHRPGQLICL